MNAASLGKTSGFTLLEVLIATTLLGLIMVILFSALRTGGTSWEAGEARIEASEEMRLVLALLRRQLRQARPDAYQDQEETLAAFGGDAQQVFFVSPFLPHNRDGGLHLIRLYVEDGRLSLRYAPFRPQRTPDEMLAMAEPQTVLEGLSAFEIGYFGAMREGDEPQWHEHWASTDTLPYLVRIAVTIGDAEPWPVLTAAVAR